MRYLGFVVVAVAVFYTLSYAKYSWGRGNKTAALGAALLAWLALVLPVLAILLSRY